MKKYPNIYSLKNYIENMTGSLARTQSQPKQISCD
jgi:hypothetical protein